MNKTIVVLLSILVINSLVTSYYAYGTSEKLKNTAHGITKNLAKIAGAL